MTNLEEIEITIDPDGRTRVQVRGVPGADCVALRRQIGRASCRERV